MKNGLPRFYKIWNSNRGDNWFIYDRSTGNKVDSENDSEKADDKLNALNDKDRKERGLPPIDAVQTSSSYYSGRNRDAQEVAPMPKYA